MIRLGAIACAIPATFRLRAATVRSRVSELRAEIAGSARSYMRQTSSASIKSPSLSQHQSGTNMSTVSRVKLHAEIEDILKGHDQEWLKTSEIAELVNQRGRYRKRDGSDVTDYQIHGRTKNYSHIFEKDGSHIRLRANKTT